MMAVAGLVLYVLFEIYKTWDMDQRQKKAAEEQAMVVSPDLQNPLDSAHLEIKQLDTFGRLG